MSTDERCALPCDVKQPCLLASNPTPELSTSHLALPSVTFCRVLPTETKVESGTSQSESGTSVNLSNMGNLGGELLQTPWLTHPPPTSPQRTIKSSFSIKICTTSRLILASASTNVGPEKGDRSRCVVWWVGVTHPPPQECTPIRGNLFCFPSSGNEFYCTNAFSGKSLSRISTFI